MRPVRPWGQVMRAQTHESYAPPRERTISVRVRALGRFRVRITGSGADVRVPNVYTDLMKLLRPDCNFRVLAVSCN